MDAIGAIEPISQTGAVAPISPSPRLRTGVVTPANAGAQAAAQAYRAGAGAPSAAPSVYPVTVPVVEQATTRASNVVNLAAIASGERSPATSLPEAANPVVNAVGGAPLSLVPMSQIVAAIGRIEGLRPGMEATNQVDRAA